ncbi:MAG: hypothetical protein ABSC54_00910 [Smithellaceae bacterium]|jgi:hypothetical protein
MKKLLCIAILLLIPSWCFALVGYTNHKIIILTGSSAASTSAGYVVPIRVSPDADPVESGTWTVNNTVYKYRIPITVKEVTGSALTNYPCLVEINTRALYQRGFISATQTGGEFEFYDGSTNYTYYVFGTDCNSLKAGFRQYRTRYYVRLSLTANQTKTIYFYFSNTVTAVSSNSKTMADIFTTYSYDSGTTTNLDDVRYFGAMSSYDDNIGAIGSYFYNYYQTTEESGMHFTGINVNSNYLADSIIGWAGATLTVSLSELGYNQGTNLSTQIVAEDTDNAAIFSTKSDYESRKRSYTAVIWNITSALTYGAIYTSPDITSVLQSVIDRSGFKSGNSINIYWQKTSYCATGQYRAVDAHNLYPSSAPRLQFTVYLHPDYKKLPTVTMPQLVVADVFLDGNSSFFPYDVAFTANDGITQLYQSDIPGRLISDTKVVTWGVKTSATIPQSRNLNIKIWYTNASQTTKHAYWSASNTFTYFNDFESGISDFTTVSGTWAQGTQQRPVIKGGVNGWTRSPVLFKTGSTYKLLDTPAWKWTDFGMLKIWETPWSQGTLHTATIIDDYWYTSGYPPYEDKSHGSTYGQVYSRYPNCVVTNNGGMTYYRTDTNPSGEITLSKSLDNGATWSFVLVIWTKGDQGTLAGGDSTGVSGFLYWETDTWYLYINYVGVDSPPLYVATRVNSSPEGSYTVYANGGVPYNLHPYTDYQEEVKVVKNGRSYYTFAGNLTPCPSPVNSTTCQRIVYATANTPLGDSSTHKFSQPAMITMNTYDGDFAEQGMASLLQDGGDWYMIYFGQPQSANNASDVGDIDNFLYLAKATSFPDQWTPQKLIKTLQSGSSQSCNTIVKNSTSYSNIVINTNLELPYGSNTGGVVFRYQDSSNYYYAFLNKTYNTVGLYKVVAGVWTVLNYAKLKFTINASGTFYPLRIGLYGSQIVVQASQYGSYWDTYINVSDASLATSGQVGFIGLNSKLYVDDIAISPYLYPEVSISKVYTPMQLTPGKNFKIGTGTIMKIKSK